MRRLIDAALPILRRALRVLVFLVVAVPLLVVVAGAGALWWANTEGGRAFIARQAALSSRA